MIWDDDLTFAQLYQENVQVINNIDIGDQMYLNMLMEEYMSENMKNTDIDKDIDKDETGKAEVDDDQTLGDMSIEDAFVRLDEITAILENAQTGLKESLEVYAEGVQLINKCRNYLCDVEKEMIMLSGQGDE